MITINYNNSKGLQKTVESVKALKCRDYEYIVVDGGSTDGSLDVIKTNSDIITVFISEKDNGIYDAINKGIKLAKGSIIGLVHSGDAILPDALTGISELHEAHPGSILYGALKTSRNGVFDSVWGWNADLLPRQMIPHLAAFVPKQVYAEYGYYDLTYKIAADYECFLRFYKQGVNFIFIDKIICDFDLDGISQRTSDAETEKEVIAIKRKYGVYVEPSKFESAKRAVKRLLKHKVKK